VRVLAVSTAAWIFIVLPLVIVWALGLVDIVRRDLPGGKKAAWILVVLLLPLVGTLVYFLLRKPSDEEIRHAQQAAAEERGDWPTGARRRLPGE
jgi:hypothetical protein